MGKRKEPTIHYTCSDQTPVKHGLPAFFLEGFHTQCPHDLPYGHSRVLALCVFLLCVAVKILPEPFMQIDLVGQPGVDGAPVSSLGFLVVTLLDHAQAFPLFPVERADTIHRVIASVNASVVARPLFWRYVVISHKK